MLSRSSHVDRNQLNITAELVNLVYHQAKPAILGSLFIASCLVYALYGNLPNKILLSWFAMMVLGCGLRYSLVIFYEKKRPTVEKTPQWLYAFIMMAATAGAMWSLAGTLLESPSSIHQTFIACSLSAIAAGSIPFFSGSREACVAFVIAALAPFAVWCFLQGNALHQFLGFLTLAYLFLLIVSCFRTYNAIYNAIKLKFKNDELVANLRLAQEEMVAINATLQTEINERKLAEMLLRESEEQYRMVTDALPVLISYIDTNLIYRFNNKVHEEWFGKSLTEITGRPVKDVLTVPSFAIFMENFEKILLKPVAYEAVMQFRGHDERYVSTTLIPHIKDDKMQGMFSLTSDITPRINYLATHDALTDLPNRSLFTARFSQALKRAYRHNSKVALLFLDLDHFKNINDMLGHDIGDMLLIKVAERMKSCLRDIDTLARFGGDEFMIILENVASDSIVRVATKICNAIRDPFQLNMHEVFITTSIGISLYPDDGSDMQTLVKNADMAIYRAKEHGRNTFEFYTKELNEKILRKINLETQLRSSLENNELFIFYQPVIDIANHQITSLEALLRWNHPKLGMVTPTEFIPVAEESGMIVSIGKWLMHEVCKQNLHWQTRETLPGNLRISVNLSPRQFKERNLVEIIREILQETGLSGEHLTLEITESLIMHDIDRNSKVIKKLKDLGISISLDDFGTGYSSLNYLRKFPLDILKVDRSFITDNINAEKDLTDAAKIVAAIIAMAHSLKIKVIAEGVETISQYNFLREHGCDEIQGFLISKPVAVSEITAFLQRAFSYENYIKFRCLDKDYADKRWDETFSTGN